jgi:uncharacterized protein involved in response to NO
VPAREPYRLFFPLGIAFGLAGVAIWPLYTFGVTATYSGRAHALVQTDGFLYAFIAGFLLTAVPRLTGTAPPSRAVQYSLAAMLLVSVAASELRAFALGTTMFVAAHATLLVLLVRRFSRRQQDPPPSFVLIGVGLLAGAVGALLTAGVACEIAPAGWDLPGKRMLTEGMVLLLVLGVGGFLGPRLLGFAALPLPHSLPPLAPVLPVRRGSTLLWSAAALAIFVSVPAEYGLDLEWMALVRAVVVTAIVIPTLQLWRTPAVKTTVSWTVWIAFWVIVIGVWHVAFAPRYRVDFLHMLFVGGFSLLILAVATRVTLSHGAKDLALERRSWPLRIGLTLGLIAMLARIGAPFATASYFEHLAFAALLWMAGVLCWGRAIARWLYNQ